VKDKNVPKKIFDVLIENTSYSVYDIYDKEHEGWNNVPKTWWLYYSDQLPGGVIPPHDSEDFVPMHVSIERLCWDIKFSQKTTSKFKWNETRFRSNTSCEMWCNGKIIYSFTTTGGSRGMSFAMSKAQYLQTILLEHPYDFLDPEKEEGRKICYHGLPATIKNSSYPGEISIVPDYSTGFSQDEWWEELSKRKKKNTDPDPEWDEIEKESFLESKDYGEINWGDALSDGNIYWFRK